MPTDVYTAVIMLLDLIVSQLNYPCSHPPSPRPFYTTSPGQMARAASVETLPVYNPQAGADAPTITPGAQRCRFLFKRGEGEIGGDAKFLSTSSLLSFYFNHVLFSSFSLFLFFSFAHPPSSCAFFLLLLLPRRHGHEPRHVIAQDRRGQGQRPPRRPVVVHRREEATTGTSSWTPMLKPQPKPAILISDCFYFSCLLDMTSLPPSGRTIYSCLVSRPFVSPPRRRRRRRRNEGEAYAKEADTTDDQRLRRFGLRVSRVRDLRFFLSSLRRSSSVACLARRSQSRPSSLSSSSPPSEIDDDE